MKRRLGQQPLPADVGLLRVLLGKCGLAQPSGWLPFGIYQVLPGSGMTSNGNVFFVTVARAFTIRSWHQAAYVATTNNGSNYWTLTMTRLSDSATVETLSTSAMSAGAWTVLSSTEMDDAITTAHKGVFIATTKTGSPGALYLAGPAVFVT